MKRLIAIAVGCAFAFAFAKEAYSAPKNKPQTKRAASQKSSGSKNGKTARSSSSSGASAVAQDVENSAEESTFNAPPPADSPENSITYTPPPTSAPAAATPIPKKAEPPLTSAADVPNDKEFDAFKKCMLMQCECSNCGETPPPHARCYKESAFEDGFGSCSGYAVAEAKKPFYKEYWWETLIPTEAEKACAEREGEWNNEKRECYVAVVFSIHYKGSSGGGLVKSSERGDCSMDRTKKVPLNGRAFMCDRSAFGLQPCYKEDATANQRNMQMMVGMMQTATVALGAVMQGVSANVKSKDNNLTSDEKQKKITNLNTQMSACKDTTGACANNIQKQIDALNNKNDGFNSRGGAIASAFGASAQDLAAGGTQMITAGMLGDQSEQAYGKCRTAGDQMTNEGGSLLMGW